MTRDRPPAVDPTTGYRGSLPPRSDRLALPWVAAVAAVFVLVFALSFAGIPSKLFASPSPNASVGPSGSAIPSGMVPSGSLAPSASP